MDNQAIAKRELSLVTWHDIRKDVLQVNKKLSDIIDALDPPKSYTFVKTSYLYGDIFVKNGEAQLPLNNTLSALSNPSIDKTIQAELCYSPMPLFLLLDKSSEFFFNAGKRVMPVNVFHNGELTAFMQLWISCRP